MAGTFPGKVPATFFPFSRHTITPMSDRPGLARTLSLAVLLATVAVTPIAAQPTLLKVSDNKRFLVTADGQPFFWLGDTAWELFHRPTREDADRYLRKRAEQRFTVIQAVALAEFDGLNEPNAYGHRPLAQQRPGDPRRQGRPDNDYWDHVDFVVKQAGALGLYVGVPADVGRQVEHQARRRAGDLHGRRTPKPTARGSASATRTRQTSSGSSAAIAPIETDEHKEIIRAMARGLRAGDGGAHLMTFHPPGGNGSSTWFHDDDVARLQHAAERPRGRIHRPVRPDARRLRSHPDQARARRRAGLRGSSGLVRRQGGSDTRSRATSDGRSTGICSPARSDTPTATTPSGRCGRRRAHRSTTRCCPGTRPSTSRARRRCSTAARSWSRARSSPAFPIPTSSSPAASRRACPAPGAISSRRRATRAAATRWCMRRSAGRSACA